MYNSWDKIIFHEKANPQMRKQMNNFGFTSIQSNQPMVALIEFTRIGYSTFGQNFNFRIRRDHQKNFLRALHL